MKIALLFLLLTSLSFAQEPEAKPKPKAKLKVFQTQFQKLPEVHKREYLKRTASANRFFQQKKIRLALREIGKLKELIPENPAMLNLEGACRIEEKKYELAARAFRRASALSPNNINFRFNLAEVKFVTKKWKSARRRFNEVIEKATLTNPGSHLIPLCRFKSLLCDIALKNEEQVAAQSTAIAKDSSEKILGHYTRLALLFRDGKKEQASQALAKARTTFPKASEHAAWLDTLIEFGYLDKDQPIDGAKK